MYSYKVEVEEKNTYKEAYEVEELTCSNSQVAVEIYKHKLEMVEVVMYSDIVAEVETRRHMEVGVVMCNDMEEAGNHRHMEVAISLEEVVIHSNRTEVEEEIYKSMKMAVESCYDLGDHDVCRAGLGGRGVVVAGIYTCMVPWLQH